MLHALLMLALLADQDSFLKTTPVLPAQLDVLNAQPPPPAQDAPLDTSEPPPVLLAQLVAPNALMPPPAQNAPLETSWLKPETPVLPKKDALKEPEPMMKNAKPVLWDTDSSPMELAPNVPEMPKLAPDQEPIRLSENVTLV